MFLNLAITTHVVETRKSSKALESAVDVMQTNN
jgi:hypothetical protein